jgi:hypothetical protein
MAGSGLSGSLGLAPEVTYGTYVAPTRHIEVAGKIGLKKVKNTKVSQGLAAGRQVPLATRRKVITKAGGGSFPIEVASKGFGLLLNQLIGGTVTPTQQGITTAYLQTHQLTSTQDVAGKYLTLQAGVPDAGGTVRPYTFLGSKVTAMEFSCGVDEYLTAAVDVDCRDVTEAETLVAPSYSATAEPFHFGQGTVKIGSTVGGAAAIQGVRKMSLKIERKMATDRFFYGNGGLKSEPLLNDFAGLSGSLDVDFITKADLADRFADDTQFALIWEFTGDLIEDTYYDLIRFTLPACFLDDETPQVDGPDLVKTPYKFTVLNDGTNAPVKVEYISTDTTL